MPGRGARRMWRGLCPRCARSAASGSRSRKMRRSAPHRKSNGFASFREVASPIAPPASSAAVPYPSALPRDHGYFASCRSGRCRPCMLAWPGTCVTEATQHQHHGTGAQQRSSTPVPRLPHRGRRRLRHMLILPPCVLRESTGADPSLDAGRSLARGISRGTVTRSNGGDVTNTECRRIACGDRSVSRRFR